MQSIDLSEPVNPISRKCLIETCYVFIASLNTLQTFAATIKLLKWRKVNEQSVLQTVAGRTVSPFTFSSMAMKTQGVDIKKADPGYKMLEQATSGPVDAITGDYLAEFNLSTNSKAFRAKTHKGWEPTCEDGLMQTLSIANEKGIKIVVNGGALNPRGLAELVHEEVCDFHPKREKTTSG